MRDASDIRVRMMARELRGSWQHGGSAESSRKSGLLINQSSDVGVVIYRSVTLTSESCATTGAIISRRHVT